MANQYTVDNLVDRDCVLLDGKCDCPKPALYNCKYGQECRCTDPHHGGKIWDCYGRKCELVV